MDIENLRRWLAERDAISILETVDIQTGARTVLKEFDDVIEAPNWTQDGRNRLEGPRDEFDDLKKALWL